MTTSKPFVDRLHNFVQAPVEYLLQLPPMLPPKNALTCTAQHHEETSRVVTRETQAHIGHQNPAVEPLLEHRLRENSKLSTKLSKCRDCASKGK